jgi:hypothetical protein
MLKGVGIHADLFEDSENLFGHSGLKSHNYLSKYLRKYFTDNYSEGLWTAMTKENTNTEFSIVRCVTYEGSKESGVGEGVIYATAGDKSNDKGPRYDYVTVSIKYEDDKGEKVESNVVAQVIMIIQLHVFQIVGNKRVVRNENRWFLIVQYMRRAEFHLNSKPRTIQHGAIKQLIWDQKDDRHRSFDVDMISIDNLVGSAMVIPYFTFITTRKIAGKTVSKQKIGTPTIGDPHISDKFWYVDRKFFDRSGWEDLTELKNSSSSAIKTNLGEISIDNDNILDFINANTIEIAIPTRETRPPLDLSEFDEYNYDDDDYLEKNICMDELEDE